MPKSIRVMALALALAIIPACASLPIETTVAAARTPDQRAYALLHSYAAMLEEAADIVGDPATPAEARAALARAERAATPAAEALRAAMRAYDGSPAGHAALNDAIAAAARAIGEVEALVRVQRRSGQ